MAKPNKHIPTSRPTILLLDKKRGYSFDLFDDLGDKSEIEDAETAQTRLDQKNRKKDRKRNSE